MSFGDKHLDRALDNWLTRGPPEYEEDENYICPRCRNPLYRSGKGWAGMRPKEKTYKCEHCKLKVKII